MLFSLFSFSLWILGENRAKLKKYLIWTADWGGEHNTPDTQSTLINFLSAVANWSCNNSKLDIISALFLIAGIHSTAKSKKHINEAITIFYSPSNVLCSSDESLQIKHLKHHIFIGMCSLFTWFKLQKYWVSVNEYTYVLNRSSRCGNVSFCKSQVFL